MKPHYKELLTAAMAAALSYPVHEYSVSLSGIMLGAAGAIFLKTSYQLIRKKTV